MADAGYLVRLRVLHASMLRHCGNFSLVVLCWDDAVYAAVSEMRNCHAVRLDWVLQLHPELAAVRLPGPARSRLEYMWTVRATFVADLARSEPVTHVDADLMFWSSPDPVFREVAGAEAAVVPHAFPAGSRGLPGACLETHRQYGLYNAGFVYFGGPRLADLWAELCVRWCYSTPARSGWRHVDSAGSSWHWYVDQGHLEQLVDAGARVIGHPGAAPGPWCAHAFDLRSGVEDDTGESQPVFGGRPLVSWHYSSLRTGPAGQLADPPYALTRQQEAVLYWGYLAELDRETQHLRP